MKIFGNRIYLKNIFRNRLYYANIFRNRLYYTNIFRYRQYYTNIFRWPSVLYDLEIDYSTLIYLEDAFDLLSSDKLNL